MSTAIEWTDITDNIIVVKGGGWWCRKSSPACDNCYAEAINQKPFFGGNKLPYTGQPPELELRREMIAGWARQRTPKKHFVMSMSDVFGPWVPREWQFEMLDGMRAAPRQTFQVLSKWSRHMWPCVLEWMVARGLSVPPRNIWLGFTAENQEWFGHRWPHMRQLAHGLGFTVFVSIEPMLGPVTLPDDFLALGRRAWVIAGGESGGNARPAHPGWFRSLRDQCKAADVPYFFKQWGEWLPVATPRMKTRVGERQLIHADGSVRAATWADVMGAHGDLHGIERVGKKAAGRRLDGELWNQFPNTY